MAGTEVINKHSLITTRKQSWRLISGALDLQYLYSLFGDSWQNIFPSCDGDFSYEVRCTSADSSAGLLCYNLLFSLYL